MADTSQDGIWIIDAFAQTTFASDRMAQILGTSPGDMLGKPSLFFVFAEDVEMAKRLFDTQKAGNQTPFRFRLRRKDGSSVRVHVQALPMFNAAGEFRGVVGIFSVVS